MPSGKSCNSWLSDGMYCNRSKPEITECYSMWTFMLNFPELITEPSCLQHVLCYKEANNVQKLQFTFVLLLLLLFLKFDDIQSQYSIKYYFQNKPV